MNDKTRLISRESANRVALVLALAGLAVLLADRVSASERKGRREEAPATLAGLDITFKMDPRLTRGLYMGDRWTSPPTYVRYAPGPGAIVEARVQGVDAARRRVDVEATWTPADPEMVTVEPSGGNGATITVRRTGESRLQVSAGGISRDLTVRGTQKDPAFQIEIIQVPLEGTPAARMRARILEGQAEQRSYALGMDLGRRLTQQSVEVDTDSLAQGLVDALEGRTLLTEQELRTTLDAYFGQLRQRRMGEALLERRRELAERSRERGAARSEQARKNKTEGEAFLAENRTREGVVALESGLQYEVLEEGEGEAPTSDDTVVCHYRGRLLDGTEFDSSHRRGRPGVFSMDRVIEGWREAIPRMSVGSKWRLFVPPGLGYGRSGTRGIPPNATLVFDVELLSIQEPTRARRQAEESLTELARREQVTP